jgi:GDP-4-dehydro-6-deoxy-D-mannose reductase
VYHLAGQSFPLQSWDDPWDTFEGNVRPQLNLFEAARRSGRQPRLLVASSTEVYGHTAHGAPAAVAETAEMRPRNPYAVSKAAQDLFGLQYAVSPGLDVVRARPANHIGPRQDRRFVAPAFASQIAEIEAGLREPVLKVGDLEARRDFTDVRDIVRAYVLLLEHGERGQAYNVGAGRPIPVRALLDGLLAQTRADIRVEVDPGLLRPAETALCFGDPARLRACTGWAPRIPLDQSLRDLLDYERARLAQPAENRSA